MTEGRGVILVIEDDPVILDVMKRYLEDDGFQVLTTRDGRKGLEMARQGVDLVIVDIGLPGLDGLEITRSLRAVSPIPILIVSARSDSADRVSGLELGADDYLTKPFVPRELSARAKALVRRARMPSTASISCGPVVVDTVSRIVTLDSERVELTPREYDLIKVLAMSPGRTFTREELLDRVWGEEYLGDTRRVDNVVAKLRGKLTRDGRPAPIRSVWGVGYRFES